LVTPLGEAEAQLFVLQDEQGPPGDSVLACAAGPCTLDQNLMVEGDLDVAGAGTFDTLEVNELTSGPTATARTTPTRRGTWMGGLPVPVAEQTLFLLRPSGAGTGTTERRPARSR
jgi:hypothetical protein